jgi:filamentous hemagglutinin family protein
MLLTAATARSAVTLDGTLGPTGSFSGNVLIPATFGTQRGANLFHSFRTFNIFSGESLYFTPAGASGAISNVISRVTGGGSSTVNGVLGSTISGANVYLLNPNGIVFGPSAQLDVRGSFYASTANYLMLADGGRFDATTPGNTVLTVAAPAAFGFLGPPPAGITLNGSGLVVPSGRTLGLIGGDLTLRNGAFAFAPSGTAHLVSAGSAGEAAFTGHAFDVRSFGALGNISLSGGSIVDVSEPIGETGGAGAIYLRGGRLVLDGGRLYAQTEIADGRVVDIAVSGDIRLANASEIDTKSFGAGRAANIRVESGGTMSVDGSTITSETLSDGDAGSLRIDAARLEVTDASRIASAGGDPGFIGRGGDITITTPGTMLLDNSTITAEAFGIGDAGNILIDAGNVRLMNLARINSSGSLGGGRGGSITITAPGTVAVNGSTIASEATGSGDAGAIAVSAGEFKLTAFAEISSSSSGAGRGGDISISAAGTASVNASTISSDASGAGDAGNIQINSATLEITNFAALNSSGSFGTGRGGNITINAGTFSLTGLAEINSSSFGSGRGGNVAITTAGTMLMDGSTITAEAFAGGNAGNVLISAGNARLINSAEIDSSGSLGAGGGGNITIATAGRMLMDASTITSEAFGSGDAGNILISAGDVKLANFSDINSSGSFGAGRGGDITIRTPGTMLMNRSAISSEAFGIGDAGNVSISAGDVRLTNFAEINSSGSAGVGRGGDVTLSTPGTMVVNGSTITSEGSGTGAAGNILISAGDLTLANFAGVDSSSGGPGRGGDITVTVAGATMITSSYIASAANGDGDAGNILIGSGRLSLSGSALSSRTGESNPLATGRGGGITLNSTGAISIDGSALTAQTDGAGPAGDILIAGESLTLAGSLINSSSGTLPPPGTGRGGEITIQTGGALAMSASRITAETFGDGNAGNILINAGSLSLANGSQITSAGGNQGFFGRGGNITINTPGAMAMEASTLTAETFGDGDAGNIRISAAGVNLSNGSRITSAGGEPGYFGRGGDISIRSPGTVSMDGSTITSQAYGEGIAGDVLINARNLSLANGAQITARSLDSGNAGSIGIAVQDSVSLTGSSAISTEALFADGGNIDISAGFMLYLSNSRITTSVGTGFGNGGNITIDPVFVILNNSQIIAQAFGGTGGNISIVTQHFIKDPPSVVDASSKLGVDGNVEISSPNTDVGANLGVLPATLFDASALLRDSCATRAGLAAANSFIGVGRGGLPLDPDSAGYSTYGIPEGRAPAGGAPSRTQQRAGSVVFAADKSVVRGSASSRECR